MITTNLTGNIGNHMWYYSICRIVAEKLGYQWGINPSPTHDYYNGMNQMYFMNVDFGEKVSIIGKDSNGLNTYQGVVHSYSDIHKHHSYNGDNCLINMYDPNVFNVQDNTLVHLISQSEDYLIERRNDILNWFLIKDEFKEKYLEKINSLDLLLDDNLCVINFRGGEYRYVSNLILSKKYWDDSISYMRSINPSMNFIIISDDVEYAKQYLPGIRCYHSDIGFDFFMVNNAKYLILANSSFSWWAGWLNQKSKLTIAPKYWSKHNISNGYWSLGDSYASVFKYMDREGNLCEY